MMRLLMSFAVAGIIVIMTSHLQTGMASPRTGSAPLADPAAGGIASLAKTIDPRVVHPGGTATLTIAVGNNGAEPFWLTTPFTDPMPSGMTVVSLNTGPCQGVTTSPTLIAMPSNAVIPVGGCTIVVIVTSSTPGTVTNVTSGLESGGITAPAASAPFSVATAPVDVTVDAPLALLLTAIAVGIGAAVHTGRARSASA